MVAYDTLLEGDIEDAIGNIVGGEEPSDGGEPIPGYGEPGTPYYGPPAPPGYGEEPSTPYNGLPDYAYQPGGPSAYTYPTDIPGFPNPYVSPYTGLPYTPTALPAEPIGPTPQPVPSPTPTTFRGKDGNFYSSGYDRDNADRTWDRLHAMPALPPSLYDTLLKGGAPPLAPRSPTGTTPGQAAPRTAPSFGTGTSGGTDAATAPGLTFEERMALATAGELTAAQKWELARAEIENKQAAIQAQMANSQLDSATRLQLGQMNADLDAQKLRIDQQLGLAEIQNKQAAIQAQLANAQLDSATRLQLGQMNAALDTQRLNMEQQTALAEIDVRQKAVLAQLATAQLDSATRLQLGQLNAALEQQRNEITQQTAAGQLGLGYAELGSTEQYRNNALNLEAAWRQAQAEADNELNSIRRGQLQFDADKLKVQSDQARAELVASLRGPRNVYVQQAVLHAMNPQGISRGEAAIAGGPDFARFQAPGATPQPVTLETFAEDTGLPIPGYTPPAGGYVATPHAAVTPFPRSSFTPAAVPPPAAPIKAALPQMAAPQVTMPTFEPTSFTPAQIPQMGPAPAIAMPSFSPTSFTPVATPQPGPLPSITTPAFRPVSKPELAMPQALTEPPGVSQVTPWPRALEEGMITPSPAPVTPIGPSFADTEPMVGIEQPSVSQVDLIRPPAAEPAAPFLQPPDWFVPYPYPWSSLSEAEQQELLARPAPLLSTTGSTIYFPPVTDS